jgi:hypothetical protein
MRNKFSSHSIILLGAIVLVFYSCSKKPLPYEKGPVMSQKSINKTFKPILEFMNYKPGMAFADVGAGEPGNKNDRLLFQAKR